MYDQSETSTRYTSQEGREQLIEKQDIKYYGLTDTFNLLYQNSTRRNNFQHLMKYVSSKKNIILATKITLTKVNHQDRDFVNTLLKNNEKSLLKLIRQKIRWMNPNKTLSISENFKVNKIIGHIAQQCYLNILMPISEGQFSINNFGFRENITEKHAFAKIINGLWKSNRNQYIININFKKYFNKNSIELLIDKLRINFKISDCIFLRNIKRLLINDIDTNNFKNLFSSILFNIFLDDLDRLYDTIASKLSKNEIKNMWTRIDRGTWDSLRKNIPYIRYCRYFTELRIITSSEKQANEIIQLTREWANKNFIKIDENLLYYNTYTIPKITIGNFKANKTKNGLIISPSNPNEIINILYKEVKDYKKYNNSSRLIGTFISIMDQYNICTNNGWIIKFIESALNNNKRGGMKLSKKLLKNKAGQRFYILPAKNRDNKIYFQPWEIRKETNKSISYYLKAPFIKNFNSNNEVFIDFHLYLKSIKNNYHNSKLIMYLPKLLKYQKYKCFITGNELQPNYIDIHHKKPLCKGGTDYLNNLVLISRDVHQYLHGLKNKDNPYKNLEKYKILETALKQ